MFKKSITFPDLDGKPVTEDFYFNLSKIELAEMSIIDGGTLADRIKLVSMSSEAADVYPVLKEIILASVGRRSIDGKRFVKSEDIRNDFLQTNAYETMIFELLRDAKTSAEFMNGVLPTDLVEQAQTILGSTEKVEELGRPKNVDEFTMTELTNMPYADFDQLIRSSAPGSLSREVLVLAMQRRP